MLSGFCTGASAPSRTSVLGRLKGSDMKSKVEYKLFRGVLKRWQTLFDEAAEFASGLEKEQLISIAHSEDKEDGVVTVWCRSR